MTTPLTADQAIALLRKHPDAYRTPEELRALAAQVDADSPGRVTVLYSGPTAKGVGSSDVIKAMLEAGEDVRVIDNSQSGKFLKARDFYGAVADVYGIDLRDLENGTYRGPATDWLYHPTQGPWADASARFADATVGEVRAIVSNAAPDRVFGATEVPHSLANPKVSTIEGIPREQLAARQASHGTQAAFEMIVSRARENVGQLQVAVNYAGTPLRGENGQLLIDSRAYFIGTEIEGRTPAFAGVTRPLADSMHPPTSYALAGTQHWDQMQAQIGHGIREQEAARTFGRRVAGALPALGAAATVYEGVRTYDRYQLLQEQGNPLAAQSAVNHTLARMIGGWTVGTAGAVLGSGAGPGGTLAGGAAGGVLGERAGERFAAHMDNARIYRQTDRDGLAWAFNGRVWEREGQADTTLDSIDNPKDTRIVASLQQARALNAQASHAAVLLALGDAAAPQNPYRLPANDQDRPSLRPADWRHDPQTGQWQRQVAAGLDRNDRAIYEPEMATAQRASELDRQSMEVVWRNIATGPAPIAAQYEIGVRGNGYEVFGEAPEAVRLALSPDRLRASDGEIYTRVADGDWARGETRAQGNLALELETTRGLMQTSVAEHQQQLAAIAPYAARSPEEREQLLYQYRIADNELNPDWAEAITVARERTRQQHGLSGPGATQLMPGPDGTVGADSAIAHLQVDNQGIPRIQAVTTTEDIHRALDEVRAQQPTASVAARPMQAEPGVAPMVPVAPAPAPDRSVANLQTGLIQLGYHRAISQPLTVNGVEDDATRQAVTAFQARNDLPVTSTFDAATQHALQQALLVQQQAMEQRQAEDRAREREQAEQQQARTKELLPYSHPDHPEHRLYSHMTAKLVEKGQLDGLSPEQLNAMVGEMHRNDFKPDWQGDAVVRNGTLYTQDIQGHRAYLRLDQPVSSVQETMQAVQTEDVQQAQIREQNRLADLHRPPPGPGQPGGPPLP